MTKDMLLDRIEALRSDLKQTKISLFDDCTPGEREAFRKIAQSLVDELERLRSLATDF